MYHSTSILPVIGIYSHHGPTQRSLVCHVVSFLGRRPLHHRFDGSITWHLFLEEIGRLASHVFVPCEMSKIVYKWNCRSNEKISIKTQRGQNGSIITRSDLIPSSMRRSQKCYLKLFIFLSSVRSWRKDLTLVVGQLDESFLSSSEWQKPLNITNMRRVHCKFIMNLKSWWILEFSRFENILQICV